MNIDWLIEFEEKTSMGREFYSQMNKQLSKSFEKATSESISGFVLIPYLNEEFKVVEAHNVFYLNANLLNVDLIFPVSISWEISNKKYFFRWLELPTLDIRNELANRRRVLLKREFNFDVEINDPVWPHVKLILHVEDGSIPSHVEEKIYSLIESWNGHLNGGFVHNAGRLVRMNNNSFSIKIDFGSTGTDFLTYLFEGLEEFSISRITIDSVIA